MTTGSLAPPIVAVLSVGLSMTAACGADDGEAQRAAEKSLESPGTGAVWLASTEPPLADPKAIELRTLIDVAGVVTTVEEGQQRPPGGWRLVFGDPTLGARRVVTLHTSDGGGAGTDWKIGYQLTRGQPETDITPDSKLAVGAAVQLRFRAIRAFGSAPAFILSDARGVLVAVNLAVYGDPLPQADLPGLNVTPGTVIATIDRGCGKQKHAALVFHAAGGEPVELRQNQMGRLTFQGTPFGVVNLFNFSEGGGPVCPDGVNQASAWALWRE